MSLWKDFSKGLWKENPVLVLMLGMCPTLAVTSNAVNGLGMGMATTFVLVGSNLVVSLASPIVPDKVRIPVYIVIIATFATVVDMLMKAYSPAALYNALGIFIPLIVVNCIVLGRAEAFASKNSMLRTLFDSFGMGIGFSFALTMVGGCREFLSHGSLFDVKLIECWQESFLLPSGAPGGFIIVGLLLAGMNYLNIRRARKSGKLYVPPAGMDCRHCNICLLDRKPEDGEAHSED